MSLSDAVFLTVTEVKKWLIDSNNYTPIMSCIFIKIHHAYHEYSQTKQVRRRTFTEFSTGKCRSAKFLCLI